VTFALEPMRFKTETKKKRKMLIHSLSLATLCGEEWVEKKKVFFFFLNTFLSWGSGKRVYNL
jgi:hypothetical protein